MIYEKCIPFDHRSTSINSLVQSSMSNETFRQWRKCCEDALNCCAGMIENQPGENFFNTCDAHWNGFSCFNEAEPGEKVSRSCPHHLTKNDLNHCECEEFLMWNLIFFKKNSSLRFIHTTMSFKWYLGFTRFHTMPPKRATTSQQHLAHFNVGSVTSFLCSTTVYIWLFL